MILERVRSEGISHNSYLIGSGNDAVIIDPRRDCQVYLDIAQQRGLRIRHILETHRNEDYTIGSIELSNLTGADIYHGPRSDWKFGNILKDGQEFSIGKLKLTAIYTPGHTDESISYVLVDLPSGPSPVMVFTGDALFVGDVGRIDLYGPDQVYRLASSLYDSLFKRLLPLGDGVILCPAHGAGSVCGAHIADRDESTLGIEKLQNPWLQKKRDDFVNQKAAERLERPHYFRQMEKHNLEGPPLLGRLPTPAPLTPQAFRQAIDRGAVVVDTSAPPAFGGAHIPGSYSIWLEGLPVFAGWVLSYDQPILLILDDQHHLEKTVRYLIRAGYDNITGYLKAGIEAWYNAGYPIEHLYVLTVHELKAKLDRGEKLTIVDDRGQDEWDSGHIKGAKHIYVGEIPDRMDDIPVDKPVAMICTTGNRATLGASILLRQGCHTVYSVLGSMLAWKAAGYPVTTD